MSRDIYNTRRKRLDDDESLFQHQLSTDTSNVWNSIMRRRRFHNFLTLFLLLVTISLVIFISFQHTIIDSSTIVEPSRAPIGADDIGVRRTITWSFGQDDESAFILDELRQLNILDQDIEGEAVLNVERIKKATYHLLLAEAAQRQDELQEAVRHYHEALRIYPALQGVYGVLGMIKMQLGEYDGAVVDFEKAVNNEPVTFAMANNLAVAYLQLGQVELAEAALLQAIELRPDYAAAYFNLANLYVQSNQPEKAVPIFNEYLELEPGNLPATTTYAAMLIELEDWENAVNILQHAERLAPDSPPIMFRIAQSLGQAERIDEAIPYLQRAVRLVDSRNALGWMSRSAFDPLRDHPDFQELIVNLETR